MLVHWIWLAHRPGLSDRAKVALLQHFSDAEEIYFTDKAAFDYIEGISDTAKGALADKDLQDAQRILETCKKEKLQLLTFQSLGHIKDTGGFQGVVFVER